MSVYRLTFAWGQANMGASETYYTHDSPNPANIADELANWLLLRTKFMYANQYIEGIRVAIDGSERRSTFMVPPGDLFPGSNIQVDIPANGVTPVVNHTQSPDQFRVALQQRFTYDTDRQAIRYLAGISDTMTFTEPATVDKTAGQEWLNEWRQFADFMVNQGWQTKALNKTAGNPASQILDVVAAPAPLTGVGLVINSGGAGSYVDGDKIIVTKTRPPKGTRAPSLNGIWYVASVDQSFATGKWALFLRNSAGILPNQVRLTDKSSVRRYQLTLYPYAAINWIRAGIHKRGKPSHSPRGRRLSRLSLDP